MSFLYVISGKYADSYHPVKADAIHKSNTVDKPRVRVRIKESKHTASLPRTSLWTPTQLQKLQQSLEEIKQTPRRRLKIPIIDCSKKEYLVPRISNTLSSTEKKYCRCLLHVLSDKIKNPYGICQSSVRPDKGRMIPCFNHYHFTWILSCQPEEFRLFYISKRYPIWIFPPSLQHKFQTPSRFKKLTSRDRILIWEVIDFLKKKSLKQTT